MNKQNGMRVIKISPKTHSDILSFDIGIKHLAYCVLRDNLSIASWGLINLCDSNPEVVCQCHQVPLNKSTHCVKKGSMIIINKSHDIFYLCGIHFNQYIKQHHINVDDISQVVNNDQHNLCLRYCMEKFECCFPKCQHDPKYQFGINGITFTCCQQHLSSVETIISSVSDWGCTINNFVPYAKSYKMPLSTIMINIVHKLNNHPIVNKQSLSRYKHILLESQPVQKNPMMQKISMFIFAYFIKLLCDNQLEDKINIKMISSSKKISSKQFNMVIKNLTNKHMLTPHELRLIKDKNIKNELNKITMKKTKTGKKRQKHDINKDIGKLFCETLLNNVSLYSYWNYYYGKFTKKDDLADCFLQAMNNS